MKVQLASIFTDHMVLQREKRVAIWGTAAKDKRIIIECGSSSTETTASEGKWKAWLPPMEAGGPYELVVRSGMETVRLRDVWFGDVWLAGGQSNMEWRLKDSADGVRAIEAANHPHIRYYDVPRIAHEEEPQQTACWSICSPATAGEYSAVAYYYAKELHPFLKVPIGIIGCNFGATSASCWMDEEYLAMAPDLRVYIDEYHEKMKDFDWTAYQIEEQRFHEAFNEYNRKAAEGATGEELGRMPWPPPLSPRSFMRPSGLYHTMLQKVVPYGIKGFIYYQGEGDSERAELYDQLLEALIHNWRRDWANDELPFLYVQLPFYAYDDDPEGEAWAKLREAQRLVSERVNHTAMVVALDCGEWNDIHPRNKKPIGERLARTALYHVYSMDVAWSGPVMSELQIVGSKLILRFKNTGTGLQAKDGTLKGFEISGKDRRYAPANAVIDGNTVQLWSEAVAEPAAVRYGWANATDANLMNSFGLPLGPFNIDVNDD